MAIRKIQVNTPGGGAVETPIGALAENVLVQTGSEKTVKDVIDEIVDFTGTDGTAPGTHGFVPAPATTDADKYLKSDGTWGAPAGGVSSVNGETGAVVLDADDVNAIPATEKGSANGVAELDSSGKLLSSQLPGSVDQVIEAADYSSLPAQGESNKIYVTLDDNKTYRWGGTVYVEISASLTLGETNGTAYRGDRGKEAYDHSQDPNKVSAASAAGLYKVGVTAEGHISSTTAVQKSDITALGIPGTDTNTTYTATEGTVGSASGWTTNVPTSLTVSDDTLIITPGSAAELTVTGTSVVTGITADA